MHASPPRHRADLVRIAVDVMVERGLEPAFPPEALRELAAITKPDHDDDPHIIDLHTLP